MWCSSKFPTYEKNLSSICRPAEASVKPLWRDTFTTRAFHVESSPIHECPVQNLKAVRVVQPVFCPNDHKKQNI